MKRYFLNLFYSVWNFRKIIKFKRFEKKLEDAVIDKSAHQVILMKEIKKEILKLWPQGRSKYIPLSLPERKEIKVNIKLKFGERMTKLNVKINDNLQFV